MTLNNSEQERIATNEELNLIENFMGYENGELLHITWNALMPVVEKIAKLEIKFERIVEGEEKFFDSYFPRTFAMINSTTKEFMVRINRFPVHQSPSLIETTFQAVIEFIKWYNSQPQ